MDHMYAHSEMRTTNRHSSGKVMVSLELVNSLWLGSLHASVQISDIQTAE